MTSVSGPKTGPKPYMAGCEGRKYILVWLQTHLDVPC